MTKEEQYFLDLLSSHINNEKPVPQPDIKWKDVFNLAYKHSLIGMIWLQIKQLPKEYQPTTEQCSYFKQGFSLTLKNADAKEKAIIAMNNYLSNAKIKHTIIKGGAIRQLYPVPDVRTSGDTDVVININDLENVANVLVSNNFILTQKSAHQNVFKYKEQEFQFKTYFDCFSQKAVDYFDKQNIECIAHTDDGYTYYLNNDYHLIYIIDHLLKHIKDGGVGIRQFMDVDIMLRHTKIDLNSVLSIIKELGYYKSAMAVIGFTKRIFNTPVEIDYILDDELFDTMLDIVLNGGVFGKYNVTTGTVRLINTSSDKGLSKSKAFKDMLVPNKNYIYEHYKYANDNHILLPVAYLDRAFNATFKRNKQNKKAIQSILKDDNMALKLIDLINELEI